MRARAHNQGQGVPTFTRAWSSSKGTIHLLDSRILALARVRAEAHIPDWRLRLLGRKPRRFHRTLRRLQEGSCLLSCGGFTNTTYTAGGEVRESPGNFRQK